MKPVLFLTASLWSIVTAQAHLRSYRLIDIGALEKGVGPYTSSAQDINERGQVMGWSVGQTVYWDIDRGLERVAALPGHYYVLGWQIDNTGTVYGYSVGVAREEAVAWHPSSGARRPFEFTFTTHAYGSDSHGLVVGIYYNRTTLTREPYYLTAETGLVGLAGPGGGGTATFW